MQVMTSGIPIPSFGPQIHHQFNEYLIFDLNFSAIGISLFCLYYLALEPVAAVRIDCSPSWTCFDSLAT